MTLKRLSLKLHALPAVAARLDCWWADSGDAGPAQAFEANRAVRSSQRLGADHYAIVSHAALLDALHERLHRVTAPAV